jgi:hypothetical protein
LALFSFSTTVSIASLLTLALEVGRFGFFNFELLDLALKASTSLGDCLTGALVLRGGVVAVVAVVFFFFVVSLGASNGGIFLLAVTFVLAMLGRGSRLWTCELCESGDGWLERRITGWLVGTTSMTGWNDSTC